MTWRDWLRLLFRPGQQSERTGERRAQAMRELSDETTIMRESTRLTRDLSKLPRSERR